MVGFGCRAPSPGPRKLLYGIRKQLIFKIPKDIIYILERY